MSDGIDREVLWLVGGVLGVLVVASVAAAILTRRVTSESGRAVVANLSARIRAWWVMCAVFAVALLTGGAGSVVLFALTSFFALREFITLVPTRHGDHRTLLWVFFLVTPIQYWLVWRDWYGMLTIFIPVYAFLLVPTRNALAGDTERFLERTATVQWALMICVYCISYAPALLTLEVEGYKTQGENAKLLLILVIVVQGSDVLQYICGKLFGRHRIAPSVSPNKTWEGFIGGIALATLIGTGLWWATPFAPWQAALMALAISLMGFAGGLTMSAIKRDRGVKDFGTLIAGHGGVLDRIDSLCFAAPVFFHLTRYFFGG
ncbi:MAG: phosphatidate cytidylyltransferase [Chloroflexota bacterium]|nr:phosphatidate cytidylyltransferase [Chloroflexota bacterium]